VVQFKQGIAIAAMLSIQFRFLTGLKRRIFQHARLLGNWDARGRGSRAWSETPMTAFVAEDGCPAFEVKVLFDSAEVASAFTWTVRLSTAAISDVSGIATEVNDRAARTITSDSRTGP